MPYFFGEADGSVRVVDTSGDGRSRPVELPSVPAAVHDVEKGRERVVVECISDGKRLVYEVTLADPPRVRCHGPVWHHAAAIKVPSSGPDGTQRGATHATHVFAADAGLLVRRGCDGHWSTVPVPHTVDLRTAFVRSVRDDLALIVERAPARTHLVPIFDSPAARTFAGHAQLPGAFARIEAVSAWSDPGFNVSPVVVLGRDDRGNAICAALLPTPSRVPLELPAGAVFRTLEGDPRVPGQFLVGYTLQNEPVVRRTLHRLPVDTLDLARCADPVRQSLLGRLREARTE